MLPFEELLMAPLVNDHSDLKFDGALLVTPTMRDQIQAILTEAFEKWPKVAPVELTTKKVTFNEQMLPAGEITVNSARSLLRNFLDCFPLSKYFNDIKGILTKILTVLGEPHNILIETERCASNFAELGDLNKL